MTHKDIYTKFMIEYDKANVTSSYPSLTEYEIATVLDKAYNTLIAQKITGNNVRRVPFESDVKSVQDLNPIIERRLLFLGDATNAQKNNIFTDPSMPDNMISANIPDNFMYFVAGALPQNIGDYTNIMNGVKTNSGNIKMSPIKFVNHSIAEKFYSSSYNKPWIKTPVCFLEDNKIYVLSDPSISIPDLSNGDNTGKWLSITYVHKPNLFVKDLDKIKSAVSNRISDISATKKYEADYDSFLNIDVNGYNTGGLKEISISRVSFEYPYKLNKTNIPNYDRLPDTVIATLPNGLNTYCIVVDEDDFDKYSINVGNIITSNQSRPLTLIKGKLLITVCAPLNDIEGIGLDTNFSKTSTEVYIISYEDLYNMLYIQDVIQNENNVWSSDTPLYLTSSKLYNSENTTYTTISSVSWKYPYELYSDAQCQNSLGTGVFDRIYLKSNVDFSLNDDEFSEYDVDTSDLLPIFTQLSLKIKKGELMNIVITYTSAQGSTFTGGVARDFVNRTNAKISVGDVIVLTSDSSVTLLDDVKYQWGELFADITPTNANLVNHDYTYIDGYTKIFAIDQYTTDNAPSAFKYTYFEYESDDKTFDDAFIENVTIGDKKLKDMYIFELDDVVAEELITLAVSYALENVESSRLNNHLQMRGLES